MAARRPLTIWGGGAIAAAVLVVPLVALLAHVPFARLADLLGEQSARDALRVSLTTATVSTLLCILLGLPLALVLDRLPAAVRAPLRTVILTPMVLPPVVAGMALLVAFNRYAVLGRGLEALGLHLAFSTAAVILAQTFVSLPFFVFVIEYETRKAGHIYDDLARAFGARPWASLWHITLPVLAPGIAVGAVMSFARSLGEYGAVITFAGSLQGTTTTMPAQIYLARYDDPDAAIALSVVLIVIAVVAIACVRPRRLD